MSNKPLGKAEETRRKKKANIEYRISNVECRREEKANVECRSKEGEENGERRTGNAGS